MDFPKQPWQCRSCGAMKLAPDADFCPHCGASRAVTPPKRRGALFRWIFALWSLLWLVMLIRTCASLDTAASTGGAGAALMVALLIYGGIWFVGSLMIYIIRRIFD